MDSPVPVKTHYVRCLKCNKIFECSRYDTNTLLEHIRIDHTEIEIVEDGDNGVNCTNANKDTDGINGYKAYNETNGNKFTDEYKGTNGYNGTKAMPRKIYTPIREAANNIVVPTPQIEDDSKINIKTTMFERTAHSPSDDFDKNQVKSTSSRERMYIRSHRVDGRGKREECDCDEGPDRSNDTNSAAYTRRYHVHTPASPTPQNDQPNRSLYRTSIEKWRPANGTIYCPKCGANRRPLIRTQAERSSNNSCCAVCILGCWPFCFLPFLLPSDNKEYLHCSNCKAFLGLYDRSSNCVKPNREYLQPEDMRRDETDPRDDDCKEKRNCRCA